MFLVTMVMVKDVGDTLSHSLHLWREKADTRDLHILCPHEPYSPIAVHVNAYVNVSVCTIASKSEQAFIDEDKTSKLSLVAGDDSLNMKRSFHISTTPQ